MYRILANIHENETYEHTGTLHITGNIGHHAKVTITDGALIVGGNIGTHAHVILKSKIIDPEHYFQVNGTIGNHVTIDSKSANIFIQGPAGVGLLIVTMSAHISARNICRHSELRSMSGHIIAGNIANQVTLFTMSGDIRVCDIDALDDLVVTNSTDLRWMTENTPFNIYANTSLFTMSGKICAGRVSAHSRLISMAGDIHVKNTHPLSLLVALDGDVYVDGVKPGIQRATYAHQISMQVQWSSDRLVEYNVIRDSGGYRNICTNLPSHSVNSPRPHLNIHVLSGFIAILGIVAVAISFAMLHVASLNPLGLIVGAIGIGMLVAGSGLFKRPSGDQNTRRESTNLVPASR